MITANVNQAEMASISKTLQEIVNTCGKEMRDVIRQAMIFAIQSAGKDTRPGASRPDKGMAKKYKKRPILSSSAKKGFFYELMDGRTFHSDKKINIWNHGRVMQNIKRPIDKVIKFWNKKLKTWDYVAYTGTAENEKFLDIPGAGAAKMGWYGGLPRLGKPDGSEWAVKYSTVNKNLSGLEQFIEVTNKIHYTDKTSPSSAAVGIAKAESRMMGIYLPNLEKKINAITARG